MPSCVSALQASDIARFPLESHFYCTPLVCESILCVWIVEYKVCLCAPVDWGHAVGEDMSYPVLGGLLSCVPHLSVEAMDKCEMAFWKTMRVTHEGKAGIVATRQPHKVGKLDHKYLLGIWAFLDVECV